jgi:hypothetical protein
MLHPPVQRPFQFLIRPPARHRFLGKSRLLVAPSLTDFCVQFYRGALHRLILRRTYFTTNESTSVVSCLPRPSVAGQ